MKNVKFILPMLAFVLALGGAIAGTMVDQQVDSKYTLSDVDPESGVTCFDCQLIENNPDICSTNVKTVRCECTAINGPQAGIDVPARQITSCASLFRQDI